MTVRFAVHLVVYIVHVTANHPPSQSPFTLRYNFHKFNSDLFDNTIDVTEKGSNRKPLLLSLGKGK